MVEKETERQLLFALPSPKWLSWARAEAKGSIEFSHGMAETHLLGPSPQPLLTPGSALARGWSQEWWSGVGAWSKVLCCETPGCQLPGQIRAPDFCLLIAKLVLDFLNWQGNTCTQRNVSYFKYKGKKCMKRKWNLIAFTSRPLLKLSIFLTTLYVCVHMSVNLRI